MTNIIYTYEAIEDNDNAYLYEEEDFGVEFDDNDYQEEVTCSPIVYPYSERSTEFSDGAARFFAFNLLR